MTRRTLVISGPLAYRMRRLAAADASDLGLNLTTLPHLAARLAGGFLRPAESDELESTIRIALDAGGFAEIGPLRDLPGTTRAAARTLRKIWDADVDLNNPSNARLADLALLEQRVRAALPPAALLPRDLRDRAVARIQHAPNTLGAIELDRLLDVPNVWRPLLQCLAQVVPIQWTQPGTSDVAWFSGPIVSAPPSTAPVPKLVTCANQRSEVIEALRWARQLLASGTAQAHEIGIAAAATDEWDEHLLTLATSADLPVHMSNGVPALSTRAGQACAALADILINGLSQDRVRRLFGYAVGESSWLADLPHNWHLGINRDAGLFQIAHWLRALAHTDAALLNTIIPALELLERGTAAAAQAGDNLLYPEARELWSRLLRAAPAEALSFSLRDLKLTDRTEAATSIVWCPATHLAGAPRRWVWLLGLNSGRWPRRIREDPLLPDHLLSRKLLDPDPIGERERRAFATILANATGGCFISRCRRARQGGLLPASPLLADYPKPKDLRRARIPQHAFSEADRLLARPQDAAASPRIRSADQCWSDWAAEEATAHDGRLRAQHPVIAQALSRPQSATSLQRLLRDPLAFVWRYALGWRAPVTVEEPLSLDPRTYGELVHELLKRAVDRLEPDPGYTRATTADIENALSAAAAVIAEQWPAARAVPPQLLWQDTLRHAERLAFKALTSDKSFQPGTRCWTEVPFGMEELGATEVAEGAWPWNPHASVIVPGTSIRIRGNIDRLDLNAPGTSVRVTDYKTGRQPSRPDRVVIAGGSELQRVIYAIAARQHLPQVRRVEPRLFYLTENAPEERLLGNVDQVVRAVGGWIAAACAILKHGHCQPGTERHEHDEYRLALPASPVYFQNKRRAFRDALSPIVKVWKEP